MIPAIGPTIHGTARRGPYPVNRGSGYSNPDIRWRWTCSVCPFSCEDRDKATCQMVADAHRCTYGWCAIPMTPERVALLGRPHIPEPTKADRARWAERRHRLA